MCDYLISMLLVHLSEFIKEIKRQGLLDSRLDLKKNRCNTTIVRFFCTKKKCRKPPSWFYNK